MAGNFVLPCSCGKSFRLQGALSDALITSLTPVRLADTRPGWVAADGLFSGTGPVPAGGVVQLPLVGYRGRLSWLMQRQQFLKFSRPGADGHS